MNIELDVEVSDAIKKMARESEDGRETGGILLGRGPNQDGIVRVECAGNPGANARREPGFFLRDLKHAQDIALAAWAENKAIWVGEWHTHLHGDPRPSPTDLATYAGHLAAADLEFEVFVSIIAIPDPEHGWGKPLLAPWLLEVSEIPVQAARRDG